MKQIDLQPIKETTEDYEATERRIKAAFRKYIYEPLIREMNLSRGVIKNSQNALLTALSTGRIVYSDGEFRGKFNSTIAVELRKIGARWDRHTKSYKLAQGQMPVEYMSVIAASQSKFVQRIQGVVKKLSQILPENIADQVKLADIFDTTLYKVDQSFKQTVKGLSVPPTLTPERRKRIAEEWSENLKLYIKDFTESEILELRKNIEKAAFAGNRYESVVKAIQHSFGVSQNKAKFLARQETSLLMTKFKEVRYTEAGINHYKWACVVGSKNHPVRPSHKKLEGKIFTWNDPPITTEPDQPVRRNNPGQDYNCRCFAIPIVKRD